MGLGCRPQNRRDSDPPTCWFPSDNALKEDGMDIKFNEATNPQPFFVPSRPEAFVKATDGKHLNIWLCQNQVRAEQLFQQEIVKYDPFVNHFGEETSVKAWTGY